MVLLHYNYNKYLYLYISFVPIFVYISIYISVLAIHSDAHMCISYFIRFTELVTGDVDLNSPWFS